MIRWFEVSSKIVMVGFAASLAACAGGGGAVGEPPLEEPEPTPTPAGCAQGASYDGTFDAIQGIVFERYTCATLTCHTGSNPAGGLDLRPDVAYDNLLAAHTHSHNGRISAPADLSGAQSTGSSMPRVAPGDTDRSFLYLKLLAATRPGSVTGVGAPMPIGGAPLSEDELELVRLWIYAGAPETGTVAGTEDLIDGCVPEPKPITIVPLAAPEAGEGVQLVMPPSPLAPETEIEQCFASYYDLTDAVPDEMKDPTGTRFRFNARELRMDPQSHHLILNYSSTPVERLDDPSFGEWRCRTGSRKDQVCDAVADWNDPECLCASVPRDTFACIGFGPADTGRFGSGFAAIGGAQQAQDYNSNPTGVYAEIPLKGVLYWNLHSFNVTTVPHQMNGRLNYYFAPPSEQIRPMRGIFNIGRIFSMSAAPFTKETICNDHVFPKGARVFRLQSHTHQRGERFWVLDAQGNQIYENFTYNDPVEGIYDPPMALDSDNVAERTLRYCATYNNGVADDGTPDIETVTRYSRLPQTVFLPGYPGKCTPKACVQGQIGAPCNGLDDDAACDSTPGAGDGWCDACPVTGGESTENEMFILLGSYYMADTTPSAD